MLRFLILSLHGHEDADVPTFASTFPETQDPLIKENTFEL